MSEPLLALRGVTYGYRERPVLAGVDLELRAGERVALVGANGAGKSTLLHLLVGLRRPDTGEVWAFGRARESEPDFQEVRARVGLLFQDSDDQLFCPTVLEDVAFGPLNLGRSESQARADAERTLDLLGLAGFADRVAHRLSAGEKRLVALATVLAMDPQVLLLDEPTNGLDGPAEARLTEHLAASPKAMLIVSHDRRFLERLATRALVLGDGRLAEGLLHAHPHTHLHSHLHIHGPVEASHHAGHPGPHPDPRPGSGSDAPAHADHTHGDEERDGTGAGLAPGSPGSQTA